MRWERDKKDSVLAYEGNLMQPVPSWGLSASMGTDVLGIFQSLEKGSKWKGNGHCVFPEHKPPLDLLTSSLLMMNNPYLSTPTHSQHQQNTIFVLLKGYLGNKSLWKSSNQQEEKLRETKKLLLLESEIAVHKQHRSHWTGITQQGQTHTAPFWGVKVKAPLVSHETSWDVQLINPSSASAYSTAAEHVEIVYSIEQHRIELLNLSPTTLMVLQLDRNTNKTKDVSCHQE